MKKARQIWRCASQARWGNTKLRNFDAKLIQENNPICTKKRWLGVLGRGGVKGKRGIEILGRKGVIIGRAIGRYLKNLNLDFVILLLRRMSF